MDMGYLLTATPALCSCHSSGMQLLLQEKRAVTPQETDPNLPVSVQESLVEGQWWPAARLEALSVAVHGTF